MSEESSPDHGGYDEWVGRVLDDRYRIDSLLGTGGMGAVFVGEHLKLMKKVAIKVIHAEFAGDGDVAERFAREAVAAGQMEHPHVASATDYGTLAEGGAYLVMQYVRGRSLRDAMDEEGALPWQAAAEIGVQVADALAAAHQKGYVHRDLKPDNVMLEPRDGGSKLVKVLDFGIARVASEKAVGGGGRTLTRVGTVIGTPGYMAPEQALGELVDYRADLYALGLLMHEMITGRPLFDQKELTAIVTRQLTETPVRLAEVAEGVPPELDTLVAQMLHRDKDGRPQGAAEIRDALRSLVLGATLQAVASGEHSISALGTTELAGTLGREPTPLGMPLGARTEDPTLAPATAATVAVATAQRPAATALPRAKTTAETVVALGRRVKKEVARARLPLPLLIVLGCAALAVLTVTIVGVSIALSGPDIANLPKREHMTPLPLEHPPPPPRRMPVPNALAQDAFDLLHSDESRVRTRAARAVLDHELPEEVPPFLRSVAELETARNCQSKKGQVEALAELGDPRALPALDRIDAEPRNGCRRRVFQRYDCYQCLRSELGAAITALRATLAD